MKKAKKGEWVEIEEVLLESDKRAQHLPEDTKKVPLVQWFKGYLLNEEAEIGDYVEVETLIGRNITGKLSDINPKHVHNFGEPIKELIDIGKELRKEVEELS
ncbi:2-amino-4-ketopentanoate thiolase [Clostridium sp. D2Q-14]|uniref:2-amino-4-oxopentanoate thiolase subunit OrtA n=1 Tax=Anaeromonas gelatinilytica TaxID=2683194 RepID=UPI00193B6A39|nr:2-amino-4-oxopentanoate thiolase subunit OrtA [Anaeromonas gelatinilytica]MBS4535186.1 2-amino-4-ketopentanoate thiolase [Anaeromonas gelatinilytica]